MTRTTITISGQEVPALYSRGLAIHREPSGRGYAIRHVRSGLRVVGRTFPTLREARAALARLLELPVDWMADRDELVRQCDPLLDQIVRAAGGR